MKRSVRLNIHQPSPFNWYNIIYRQILWKIMIIHCDVVIINCDVIPNNTQNIDCWCLYHVIHFIRPYQPVSRKKVVAHHMYDILWSSPESEVFTVLKNIQPPVIIYYFVGYHAVNHTESKLRIYISFWCLCSSTGDVKPMTLVNMMNPFNRASKDHMVPTVTLWIFITCTFTLTSLRVSCHYIWGYVCLPGGDNDMTFYNKISKGCFIFILLWSVTVWRHSPSPNWI